LKTNIFLSCLLVLVVTITIFYCYRIQPPTIVVTTHLDLTVHPDLSSRLGHGWIREQNTSVSLIKWPQTGIEKIDVNPKYAFNETRTTPVQFAVSIYFDEANKTLLTPNLTLTGSYSGEVSSTFPRISQGTYNLTITLCVLGYQEDLHQLQRIITIP